MNLLVLTSSRADFGILQPLLVELDDTDGIDLGLLVSGTHLAPAHGLTVTDVERSGLPIVARAEILDRSPPPSGTPAGPGSDAVPSGEDWRQAAGVLGRAVDTFAGVIDDHGPHRALVLGDRFEAFGFAAACHLAGLPVAHLHGGEVTTGAFDDGFRHSITKFSSLHLVAAEPFRRRVIQLGEHPDTVHTVGALGLDAIRQRMTGRRHLRRTSTAVVAYHPATRSDEWELEMITTILKACQAADLERIVITRPNVDPGAGEINRVIDEHLDVAGVEVHESLGSERYLDELATCQVLIGNSSSGIIEAPFLGTPSINVGHRQDGRPRHPTTTDLPAPSVGDLVAAIERTNGAAEEPLLPTVYGNGRSARRAAALIAGDDWAGGSKHFFDLALGRLPEPRTEPLDLDAHDDLGLVGGRER